VYPKHVAQVEVLAVTNFIYLTLHNSKFKKLNSVPPYVTNEMLEVSMSKRGWVGVTVVTEVEMKCGLPYTVTRLVTTPTLAVNFGNSYVFDKHHFAIKIRSNFCDYCLNFGHTARTAS
jgi:hypothetical protein